MASFNANFVKAARFERPEYIPMKFSINVSCGHHYPDGALEELVESHKFLFPKPLSPNWKTIPATADADTPFIDAWGCKWVTSDSGITGVVSEHPLANWNALDNFTPPDPDKTNGRHVMDWERIRNNFRLLRETGEPRFGSLDHGHTFLLLCNLRGYENLIFDMIDEEPRLKQLIEMVENYNLEIVRHYVDAGVTLMRYPEDLGMQIGPMLSPDNFRKYIKPSYQRLMEPARQAGCIIHMHSDGDIRKLAGDLIDGGVKVVNLQDLVNGIDWIRNNLKGKVAIDLDIDRQNITSQGPPEQIDTLIREEVEKLGSREGGLSMIYGLYPGIPLENVKAVMDAMEKYAGYYS